MRSKSTIRYTVQDGVVPATGTHYVAAKSVLAGTLDFQYLCEEACDGNTIKPSEMVNAVSLFVETVKRNLKKGFCCNVGDQFLTVYPKIRCTAVDEKDPVTGAVTHVAEHEEVKASMATCKKSIASTVSSVFSQDFASSVQWQKVKANGELVDDEEDDEENEDIPGGGSGGDNTGGNGGGGGNDDLPMGS